MPPPTRRSVKLLAQQLDCPRNRVDLIRGHTSRHKTIKLYGLTPEEVVAKLGKLKRCISPGRPRPSRLAPASVVSDVLPQRAPQGIPRRCEPGRLAVAELLMSPEPKAAWRGAEPLARLRPLNSFLKWMESTGAWAPWCFLGLFIAASFLMIWRLEAMTESGVEGTVLGTLVMPYCSGMGNLIFAFVLGAKGGPGAEVVTNSLVNNVTNMTLLIGLPAILWGMNVLPAAKAKKKSPARSPTPRSTRSTGSPSC